MQFVQQLRYSCLCLDWTLDRLDVAAVTRITVVLVLAGGSDDVHLPNAHISAGIFNKFDTIVELSFGQTFWEQQNSIWFKFDGIIAILAPPTHLQKSHSTTNRKPN